MGLVSKQAPLSFSLCTEGAPRSHLLCTSHLILTAKATRWPLSYVFTGVETEVWRGEVLPWVFSLCHAKMSPQEAISTLEEEMVALPSLGLP